MQSYEFLSELGIGANDIIFMVASCRSNKITIEDLDRFIGSGSNVAFEYVDTGVKNAMDFQLGMSLAIEMTKNKDRDDEYFIVSEDSDFELVSKYLNNRLQKKVHILNKRNYEMYSKKSIDDNLDSNVDNNIFKGIDNNIEDLIDLIDFSTNEVSQTSSFN